MRKINYQILLTSLSLILSVASSQSASAITGPDRIVKPGEASYTAAIQYYDGLEYATFCSGSLISSRIILTAAHCILDTDPESANTWVARIGQTTQSGQDGQRVNIVGVIYHKNYTESTTQLITDNESSELIQNEGDTQSTPSWYNADIAILLLESPIVDINPVKMAKPNTKLYDGWRVYGWGHTATYSEFTTDTLLTTAVNDATEEMSRELKDPMENLYGAYGLDASGNVQTTCYGDSGGPLVDGNGILIGITSFANATQCEDLVPTGYTKVSSYQRWVSINSSIIKSRYERSLTKVPSTPMDHSLYPDIYNQNRHDIIILGRR